MSHFIDAETPCLREATREPVWKDACDNRRIPVYLKE
jgi:hypothetical protein